MSTRRRPTRIGCTWALLAVQVIAVVATVALGGRGELQNAPVAITGPPVVAQALATQVDALTGHPVEAVAVASTDEAKRAVVEGRAVAAVDVDVRLDRATVLVASVQGQATVDAIEQVARRVSEPFAAEVAADDVASVPAGSWGRPAMIGAVVFCLLAGFGSAVAVTWLRGPVAGTLRGGVRRAVAASMVAAVVGGVVAAVVSAVVGGSVVDWWVVASLTMLVAHLVTAAFESLWDELGLGLAALTGVLAALPAVRVGDAYLVPDPWRTLDPWLVHGASLQAASRTAWFGGAGIWSPVAVLAAWGAIACLVMIVARRERGRGTPTPGPGGRARARESRAPWS
jgi:hypothetical protein